MNVLPEVIYLWIGRNLDLETLALSIYLQQTLCAAAAASASEAHEKEVAFHPRQAMDATKAFPIHNPQTWLSGAKSKNSRDSSERSNDQVTHAMRSLEMVSMATPTI